jgi:arylsulfatase A-like enzyme
MSEKAQAYATLIEGIDKSLGDIVLHVKKLGLGENTLIFFLGDNGSDAPLPIENNYSSSSPLKGKKPITGKVVYGYHLLHRG